MLCRRLCILGLFVLGFIGGMFSLEHRAPARHHRHHRLHLRLVAYHDLRHIELNTHQQLVVVHKTATAVAIAPKPVASKPAVPTIAVVDHDVSSPTTTIPIAHVAQEAAPPAPIAQPAPVISDATSTNTPDWRCIRQHESNDTYTEPGGGAYQFENGTWTAVTGLPGPAQSYSPWTQDQAALKLYSQRGFEPWSTRFICGL